MTGRFRQALTEMRKSKKGRKCKMPKNFSVSSGDKSKAGGLTAKGVKRYRAANPGSKLKTAVTTKPSKLKKGSKSAKRRKSFCARMGGMKKRLTSKKTASNPDSRINKALRKWNCSTDVNPNTLDRMSEMIVEGVFRNFGRGFRNQLTGGVPFSQKAGEYAARGLQAAFRGSPFGIASRNLQAGRPALAPERPSGGLKINKRLRQKAFDRRTKKAFDRRADAEFPTDSGTEEVTPRGRRRKFSMAQVAEEPDET